MHVFRIANRAKKWNRNNLDNYKSGQVLHNEKTMMCYESFIFAVVILVYFL